MGTDRIAVQAFYSHPPSCFFVQLLTEMTAISPTHTEMTIKYILANRITKSHHCCKLKSLKLIISLCRSLPPSSALVVKRVITTNPSYIKVIRDLTMFKGPPDPLRGDEIYRRVREAAKECIEAVYEANNDVSSNAAGNSLGVQMQGIGGEGNAFGAAGGGGGAGNGAQLYQQQNQPGAMQGIGSSNAFYEKNDRSFLDRAREATSTAAKGLKQIVKDPLARNIGGHSQQRNGGSPYDRGPPGRNETIQRTGGEWTMASNRGTASIASRQREPPMDNGAYSWAKTGGNLGGGGVGSSWAGNNGVNNQPHVSAGKATSDGTYERQLITTLTTPAGFKPSNLNSDELAQFMAVVFNLNPDIVCPILLDVIATGEPVPKKPTVSSRG